MLLSLTDICRTYAKQTIYARLELFMILRYSGIFVSKNKTDIPMLGATVECLLSHDFHLI